MYLSVYHYYSALLMWQFSELNLLLQCWLANVCSLQPGDVIISASDMLDLQKHDRETSHPKTKQRNCGSFFSFFSFLFQE